MTTSGFLLPEEAASAPQIAEVINAGDCCSYKSKDRIVYKSYSTTDITLEGKDYFLISDEDVLGTVV